MRRGIGRAFQIASIFSSLTVREAILGAVNAHRRWYARLGRRFPLAEAQAQADEVMELVGLTATADTLSGNLSHGDQKVLDIALALALDPRVLLLDEPTAGMGPEERWQMMETVHQLWERKKMTLIFIEHDMDIVFKFAQTIRVLSYGRVLAEGTPEEVRRQSQGHRGLSRRQIRRGARMSDRVMFEAQGIDVFYGTSQILFDVSIAVVEGQTMALLGRNGAGKSTTLKAIAGIAPPARGRVRVTDAEVQGRKPYVIARAGIGFVPEDRQVFPEHSVEDNLVIGAKKGPAGQDYWNLKRIYEMFPLLAPLKQRMAGHLSGGEQQMLTIARTLMGNPIGLLLDEPSEGLAPVIVERIGELLRRLRDMGVTVLLAEQNMHFCLGIASHATIIDKGQIVYREHDRGAQAGRRGEEPLPGAVNREALNALSLTIQTDGITIMGCLLKQGGGLYPRLRIGAVLLAAGEGRRMGGVAKPLIRLQGVPLISRHLVALERRRHRRGGRRHRPRAPRGRGAGARASSVTLAHNDAHADGQQGSVRVGLRGA